MSHLTFDKKTLKQVLFTAGTFLEALLILPLLYSVFVGSPAVILRIVSDSMIPFLKVGDFILIKKLDYSNPRNLVHKVIAFYDPVRGGITVHRVIQSDAGCYITKGDNSQFSDIFEPCPPYILGEVWLKI